MKLKIALLATGLLLSTTAAYAECGAGPGSVRILSNDFDALHVIAAEAQECASDTTTVTINQTTEHKSIQVPALSINPAEFTVAVIANNSVVPLLDANLIRPLDDLVSKYGQDLEDSQLIKVDGKVIAIAFMANAQHLFYRKDVFEEAGLTPPKSYEDILAAAKVIREKGIMQNPLGAADMAGWDLAAEFVNMYLGYGGDFFASGTGELSIDNEAGRNTLATMKAMTAYMNPGYMSVDSTELRRLWESGDIAIMSHWGSLAGTMLDPAAGHPEIAAETVIGGALMVGGGSVPAAALWWDGFSIAANISDEDAAASFQTMMYATRPAIATDFPEAAVWLIKGFKPGPSAVGVFETASTGARSYPMLPYMTLLHDALGAELADFMQGSEDADQALADINSAYTTKATESGLLN